MAHDQRDAVEGEDPHRGVQPVPLVGLSYGEPRAADADEAELPQR
jgi:hypothetical protein